MTATLDRPAADLEEQGFPMFSGDLADGLVEAHRAVVRAEAERLRWVAEVVATEAHLDLGYLSALALIVDRLDVSVGFGRRLIGLASALGEMPVVAAGFDAGEVD
jgi:hypothetical protein